MSGPVTTGETEALQPAERPVIQTAGVEITEAAATAHRDWTEATARFGHVDSQLPRYEIDPPPWRPQ